MSLIARPNLCHAVEYLIERHRWGKRRTGTWREQKPFKPPDSLNLNFNFNFFSLDVYTLNLTNTRQEGKLRGYCVSFIIDDWQRICILYMIYKYCSHWQWNVLHKYFVMISTNIHLNCNYSKRPLESELKGEGMKCQKLTDSEILGIFWFWPKY